MAEDVREQASAKSPGHLLAPGNLGSRLSEMLR